MACIASFHHPARYSRILFTFFCSRSITLAVTSYVVAYRLFRFCPSFNWLSTHSSRNMQSNPTLRHIRFIEIQVSKNLLPHSFLSVLLCHYSIRPAYLFATEFSSVSSDSGASWTDYILWYLNQSFTVYALRLTMSLHIAFGIWYWLLTRFQLHSPLIVCDIPDDFITDGKHAYNAFIT